MKKLIRCKNGINKEMTLDEVVKEFDKMTHTKDVIKWCSHYEKDDLIQIAYIGLIKAYNYYDISQNMSFVPYAKKVIKDIIFDTYKRDKRQKRGGDIETCSIYSIVDESDDLQMIETIKDDNCNCEESALLNITNQKISEVLKTFSSQEQDMINLHFMKGLNYAEIGRMYDKTRECIRYRIKQIKKKLQIELKDEVSLCM